MYRCYFCLLYLLSYHSPWLKKDLGRIILMEGLPWLWAVSSSSVRLSSSLFIWTVRKFSCLPHMSLWGRQANSSCLSPLPVNFCLLYMMQGGFPTQSLSATESLLTVSKSQPLILIGASAGCCQILAANTQCYYYIKWSFNHCHR